MTWGASAEEGVGEGLSVVLWLPLGVYITTISWLRELGDIFRPLRQVHPGLRTPNHQSLPWQGQASLY